jgi:hypothetical protein
MMHYARGVVGLLLGSLLVAACASLPQSSDPEPTPQSISDACPDVRTVRITDMIKQGNMDITCEDARLIVTGIPARAPITSDHETNESHAEAQAGQGLPFALADLCSMAPPMPPSELPDDDGEEVGEARGEFAWAVALKLTCVLGAALAAHHLCDHAEWWQRHCPRGTSKAYTDQWGLDLAQKYAYYRQRGLYSISVSCDALHELACEGAAVGAGEALREICSLFVARY